jgi:hypothetical protein
MKTISHFLVIFLFLNVHVVIGQDYEINRISNKSGTESSTTTGGNGSSVDMFRGTLNTSIPIHSHNGREIRLPISMSYTANGIKVDQIASNVGLGWNLNAGGRITRIVSGNADDRTTANTDRCPNMLQEGSLTENLMDFHKVSAMGFEDMIQYKKIINNEFNFNEGAGAPYSIVNPFTEVNTSSVWYAEHDTSWHIKDPEGNNFYFGNGKSEVTTSNSTGEGCNNVDEKSTTAWLVTKVVSKNQLDTYTFNYESFEWANEIMNNGEGQSKNGVLNLLNSSYKLKQQMLTEIYYNGILLAKFNYGNRDDLTFTGNGNALLSIDFYDFRGETIYKKVDFEYSYFGDTYSPNYLDKRLKLDKIIFNGIKVGEPPVQGDIYKFDYIHPELVPPIDSYARDYLGLFNNRIGNTNLVENALNTIPPYCNPSGSNRSYNHDYATYGTLSSITYPTKGTTEFEYEQNALEGGYGINDIPPTAFIDGFRIKSITNYDSDHHFITKKGYRYDFGFICEDVNNYHEVFTGVPFDHDPQITRYRLSRGYANSEIVHYQKVYEIAFDETGNNNGYTKHFFEFNYVANITPFKASNDPTGPTLFTHYDYLKNDLITKKIVFNKSNQPIYEEQYTYEIPDPHFDLPIYNLTKIKSITYIAGNPNSQIENIHEFFNHFFNQVGATKKNGDLVEYQYSPNVYHSINLQPLSHIFSATKGDTQYVYSEFVTPATPPIFRYFITEIKHAKHGDTPEPISQFIYDNNGNKVQTTMTSGNGTPLSYESYIYGYNDRFVVAKLTGVPYSDIATLTTRLTNIKDLSNRLINDTNEIALINELNLLRTDFPNALITTYTYNPVYGVTSVTDPKGYTVFSEYDAFGRVKLTKERHKSGNGYNIISENQYHTISNP